MLHPNFKLQLRATGVRLMTANILSANRAMSTSSYHLERSLHRHAASSSTVTMTAPSTTSTLPIPSMQRKNYSSSNSSASESVQEEKTTGRFSRNDTPSQSHTTTEAVVDGVTKTSADDLFQSTVSRTVSDAARSNQVNAVLQKGVPKLVEKVWLKTNVNPAGRLRKSTVIGFFMNLKKIMEAAEQQSQLQSSEQTQQMSQQRGKLLLASLRVLALGDRTELEQATSSVEWSGVLSTLLLCLGDAVEALDAQSSVVAESPTAGAARQRGHMFGAPTGLESSELQFTLQFALTCAVHSLATHPPRASELHVALKSISALLPVAFPALQRLLKEEKRLLESAAVVPLLPSATSLLKMKVVGAEATQMHTCVLALQDVGIASVLYIATLSASSLASYIGNLFQCLASCARMRCLLDLHLDVVVDPSMSSSTSSLCAPPTTYATLVPNLFEAIRSRLQEVQERMKPRDLVSVLNVLLSHRALEPIVFGSDGAPRPSKSNPEAPTVKTDVAPEEKAPKEDSTTTSLNSADKETKTTKVVVSTPLSPSFGLTPSWNFDLTISTAFDLFLPKLSQCTVGNCAPLILTLAQAASNTPGSRPVEIVAQLLQRTAEGLLNDRNLLKKVVPLSEKGKGGEELIPKDVFKEYQTASNDVCRNAARALQAASMIRAKLSKVGSLTYLAGRVETEALELLLVEEACPGFPRLWSAVVRAQDLPVQFEPPKDDAAVPSSNDKDQEKVLVVPSALQQGAKWSEVCRALVFQVPYSALNNVFSAFFISLNSAVTERKLLLKGTKDDAPTGVKGKKPETEANSGSSGGSGNDLTKTALSSIAERAAVANSTSGAEFVSSPAPLEEVDDDEDDLLGISGSNLLRIRQARLVPVLAPALFRLAQQMLREGTLEPTRAAQMLYAVTLLHRIYFVHQLGGENETAEIKQIAPHIRAFFIELLKPTTNSNKTPLAAESENKTEQQKDNPKVLFEDILSRLTVSESQHAFRVIGYHQQQNTSTGRGASEGLSPMQQWLVAANEPNAVKMISQARMMLVATVEAQTKGIQLAIRGLEKNQKKWQRNFLSAAQAVVLQHRLLIGSVNEEEGAALKVEDDTGNEEETSSTQAPEKENARWVQLVQPGLVNPAWIEGLSLPAIHRFLDALLHAAAPTEGALAVDQGKQHQPQKSNGKKSANRTPALQNPKEGVTSDDVNVAVIICACRGITTCIMNAATASSTGSPHSTASTADPFSSKADANTVTAKRVISAMQLLDKVERRFQHASGSSRQSSSNAGVVAFSDKKQLLMVTATKLEPTPLECSLLLSLMARWGFESKVVWQTLVPRIINPATLADGKSSSTIQHLTSCIAAVRGSEAAISAIEQALAQVLQVEDDSAPAMLLRKSLLTLDACALLVNNSKFSEFLLVPLWEVGIALIREMLQKGSNSVDEEKDLVVEGSSSPKKSSAISIVNREKFFTRNVVYLLNSMGSASANGVPKAAENLVRFVAEIRPVLRELLPKLSLGALTHLCRAAAHSCSTVSFADGKDREESELGADLLRLVWPFALAGAIKEQHDAVGKPESTFTVRPTVHLVESLVAWAAAAEPAFLRAHWPSALSALAAAVLLRQQMVSTEFDGANTIQLLTQAALDDRTLGDPAKNSSSQLATLPPHATKALEVLSVAPGNLLGDPKRICNIVNNLLTIFDEEVHGSQAKSEDLAVELLRSSLVAVLERAGSLHTDSLSSWYVAIRHLSLLQASSSSSEPQPSISAPLLVRLIDVANSVEEHIQNASFVELAHAIAFARNATKKLRDGFCPPAAVLSTSMPQQAKNSETSGKTGDDSEESMSQFDLGGSATKTSSEIPLSAKVKISDLGSLSPNVVRETQLDYLKEKIQKIIMGGTAAPSTSSSPTSRVSWPQYSLWVEPALIRVAARHSKQSQSTSVKARLADRQIKFHRIKKGLNLKDAAQDKDASKRILIDSLARMILAVDQQCATLIRKATVADVGLLVSACRKKASKSLSEDDFDHDATAAEELFPMTYERLGPHCVSLGMRGQLPVKLRKQIIELLPLEMAHRVTLQHVPSPTQRTALNRGAAASQPKDK